MHRPMLVALAALLLSSCRGEPPRVASTDLTGSWRNEQGATISFRDTGVVLFTRPDPKTRPAVGEYLFDGESLTLRFRPEARWCTGDAGTYRVKVTAGSFDATTESDACKERERLVRGRWQRLSEGRLTPES